MNATEPVLVVSAPSPSSQAVSSSPTDVMGRDERKRARSHLTSDAVARSRVSKAHTPQCCPFLLQVNLPDGVCEWSHCSPNWANPLVVTSPQFLLWWPIVKTSSPVAGWSHPAALSRGALKVSQPSFLLWCPLRPLQNWRNSARAVHPFPDSSFNPESPPDPLGISSSHL